MYSTTLDKKLTKYCKKFGIKKVKCGEEFAYFPTNRLINYTLLIYKTDFQFINLVNTKYNANIEPWYFIFCLLHEVGHHMTMDELTNEDLLNDLFLRQVVIPSIKDEDRKGKAYINLTAEDLATTWALDYIDTHLKECFEFQNQIIKEINHIKNKKSFQKYINSRG